MRARRYLLAVLALLVLGGGQGQCQGEGVTEILRQAPARIEEFTGLAKSIARDSSAKVEEFEEVARSLAEKNIKQVQEEGKSFARSLLLPEPELLEDTSYPESSAKNTRVLLFMTLGQEPDRRVDVNRRTLKEMDRDTVAVLRGLPHGKRSLADLFRYVHLLAGDRRDPKYQEPRVLMDPRLYSQYGVEVSPTLVYEKDGRALAWVRGLVNASWLKDQVEKEGRTGDLGKYGPTEAIAEKDFLEEIRERLASIDWDARKEKAWEQYWTRYSFLTLPPANRDRVYQVEAVYKVPQDFRLPDGKVLARKGDKINLFDKVKPRFVLVVFDGSDPLQLAWAKDAAREYRGQYRVQYLTTALPERTWESFSKLEAPLYLLNDAVRDRFQLEHVPSLVRPLNDRFEIREVGLKKNQGEGDASPEAR